MLAPDELKLLHPRRRLAPFSPPTPLDILTDEQGEEGEEEEAENWKDRAPASSSKPKPQQVSASYLWSGLVRIDILSGPPSTSLVFYGPKSMRVAGLPLLAEGQEVDLDFEEDLEEGSDADEDGSRGGNGSIGGNCGSSGSRQRVLHCKESVAARGGLVPHVVRVPVPQIPTSQCLADVAVSGLPGWVALYAPFAKRPIDLRVWVPRGVEVFLRPPMPCPAPAKPSSWKEGEVGEEDLVDIGAALDMSEADIDWELHR
jgi:nitric-oxide synthase